MSGKDDGAKETPQQAAMVEKATAEMQDYKTRWLPLQKRMAQQIQDLASDDSADRKLAKGRANIESQAKFGQAQEAVEKSLTNSGRGPGSAAFGMGVTGLASDMAASKGAGMASADAAIDDAYVAGLGALTAIGRGEKAEALKGQSQLAAMSGRQAAADAEASAAARAGNMQLAGTVAGFGLSQAMKPSASSVPQSALDRANGTRDPLGSLNSQMGWTN